MLPDKISRDWQIRELPNSGRFVTTPNGTKLFAIESGYIIAWDKLNKTGIKISITALHQLAR